MRTSEALHARELDLNGEINVLLADDFRNYKIYGRPFFLSGETPVWHSLAHRSEFGGINLRCRHRASRINAATKTFEVGAESVGSLILLYEKLLIGTDAGPAKLFIERNPNEP